MLVAVKVDLTAASSLYLFIMVDSRYSENGLATASSYRFLLALVIIKYLKHTQTRTKKNAKLSKKIKPH